MGDPNPGNPANPISPIQRIPVTAPNPGKMPQPTASFNPQAILAQTAAKNAALNAEAQKKEEAAIAVDNEKFAKFVGHTFRPKDPTKSGWEIKTLVFQARINLGPGGMKPGFLIERTRPHSSWWVPAQNFLDTHEQVA